MTVPLTCITNLIRWFAKAGLSSRWLLLLPLVVALAGCRSLPPNSLASHDSSRWTNDIATLEARAATNTPGPNPIVFVGSSSIRLWTTLSSDFSGYPVLNQGFGGSQLADSSAYAERIILPYRPRQVVIYAGGNDINAGKTPEVVFGDFVALVSKLRARLPRTRLSYISSAPSPSRWKQVEKVKRLNSLVEAYCQTHQIDFINIVPLVLGPDGLPRPEIYAKDKLHFNEWGYTLWRQAVAPYLVAAPSDSSL